VGWVVLYYRMFLAKVHKTQSHRKATPKDYSKAIKPYFPKFSDFLYGFVLDVFGVIRIYRKIFLFLFLFGVKGMYRKN
jgi:hypothetical protein